MPYPLRISYLHTSALTSRRRRSRRRIRFVLPQLSHTLAFIHNLNGMIKLTSKLKYLLVIFA
jgi:hypothetical protein